MQPEQPVEQVIDQVIDQQQDQTAVLSRSPFQRINFSRRQLMVFAIVFAAIGGYILWKSFALGVVPFGSYETGNLSEFRDSTCGSSHINIVKSPVRQGTYAAQWSADTSTQCYGDTSNVRMHMLGFPTGTSLDMNAGSTFWKASSIYIPTTANIPSNGWFALDEIHQSNSGTGCIGPAPFNLDASGGTWKITIRGYPECTQSVFKQVVFGEPQSTSDSTRLYYPFANGVSTTIQKGQWYDFLFGWHMATDNTGWFEAWMNGPGTNGKSVSIVPRMNMPTSYNVANYPMESIYYPVRGNSTAQVVYDGGAYSTDFASIRDWQNSFTHSWGTTTTGSAPTVSLSASPTSVTAGTTSKLSWTSTNATSCAASGGWSGSQPTSGSFTTAALNAATTFSLTCTGAGGSAVASSLVSVTAATTTTSVTATSSVSDGAVLNGVVPWVVTTSQPVHSVDYYMNNVKIGSVVKDGTSFSYSLDTNLYPGVTHGGFQVYDSSGALVYRSPSIGFTISNPSTPPAVSTNAWTGQYYDNLDLTNLKVTRVDPQINFNWASGTSPDATIAPTTYSSTWKGSFSFDTANYNFSVTADDGVRVYIDGALKLDKWLDTYPATYNFTAGLSAGAHVIQVNYYNDQGGGTANVSWAKQVALPVGTGLSGGYYDNQDFTNLKFSRLDSTLNFNWGQGSPSSSMGVDTYSIRWAGKVLAKSTAAYTFTTKSDDGIRLWINGNLLINNWTNHSVTSNSATVNLSQGQLYSIKVEYYESTGSSVAQLLWSTPTMGQVVVPASQLFPS